MSITYSECVFVCVCVALPRKRNDLKKKSYWVQNMCFDFSTTCLKHFSFIISSKRDIIKNIYIYRRSCKVPVSIIRF